MTTSMAWWATRLFSSSAPSCDLRLTAIDDLRRAKRSGVGGGSGGGRDGEGAALEIDWSEGVGRCALGCGRSTRRTVAP